MRRGLIFLCSITGDGDGINHLIVLCVINIGGQVNAKR